MDEKLRLRFELHGRLKSHRYRVRLARERITEWLEVVGNPYVAFSTGKDSTVCLHLVREQCPDIPAVYIDADCSYPESIAMLDTTPGVIRYPADEPFLDTLARFGFGASEAVRLDRATMQSTVWGPVKRLTAEYGFDGMCYGLRAEESHGRRKLAQVKKALFYRKYDNVWVCQPIHDWNYSDVWAYIVTNELPYCGVYDRMWDMPEADQRLSYWAGETKRHWGRWAWLKRNYPDLFNRLAEKFPEARGFT